MYAVKPNLFNVNKPSTMLIFVACSFIVSYIEFLECITVEINTLTNYCCIHLAMISIKFDVMINYVVFTCNCCHNMYR